jgi:hypothetical protein
MLPQPLFCVTNVERSSGWYQALLGCESGTEATSTSV